MSAEEIDGTDTEQGCSACRQLRLEGQAPIDFVVVPGAGGGWHQWAAALARLLGRIGTGPTQALIIGQRPFTQRYVQMLIGHGQAHVEASSNVYLEDGSRLSPEHEELLARIGWRVPNEADDALPANWTLPLVRGGWDDLVEVVLATVAGVFGFDERLAVQVHTFQADHPCRDCFPEVGA
jgi:hypothetical protein